MLVYMLGHNEMYWYKVYEIADKLDLNLKIIPVFTNDLKRKGCLLYPVGPAEFLNLFRNADFVCTDSFHGMLFSIIFHVNFIEFKRFCDNDPINQNFRIFNIAAMLGLENRISDAKVPDVLLKSSVNFRDVDSKLNILREDSLRWLKDALDSITSFAR